MTLPDGIVVNYGYDQASELTGLSYSQGGNVLGNLTYAYDADGRRTQMSGTWARTGMPNPATSTAVYSLDDKLTDWNGATLTYDLNGNLVNDSANTYTWSPRNQLASISDTTAASFVYGPFGRRQQKTINGAATDFLYDGVNPVWELSGATVTVNLLTELRVVEMGCIPALLPGAKRRFFRARPPSWQLAGRAGSDGRILHGVGED